MVAVTTTRDLKRFRPLTSPCISTLSSAFFTLLAAESSEAASLRTAFLPALLNTTNPRASPLSDLQLRQLFQFPPKVVVVQGVITQETIDKLWNERTVKKEGGEMGEEIYLGFALHTEIQRAHEEGEQIEEANLSIMVLTTLAYELAHWIYTKTHGYRSSLSAVSSGLYLRGIVGNASSASFASMHTLVADRDRLDVGDQAAVSLIGADLELLTYSIGERQLVKRRVPTRRSPLLTPPIIYQLTHQTPQILDITTQPQSLSNTIPSWKEGDSMYAVVSVLTPAGGAKFWGYCSIEESASGGGMEGVRRGSNFGLVDQDNRRGSGFSTIEESGRRDSSAYDSN